HNSRARTDFFVMITLAAAIAADDSALRHVAKKTGGVFLEAPDIGIEAEKSCWSDILPAPV
ncbi:MAG: hypothetical protein R6V75_08590, partial [Bacteroidales bacterium]